MNFTQLFCVEEREGRGFRGSEAAFCGWFWGGGEARMGGFAAEFRGFWGARGCGAAIQRTVDTAGVIGRKNFLKIFKKGVENRKLGV